MVIAKEKETEILRLYHGEKWPVGTIAGQLGLHHTTVQRVLGQAGVDPKVVAPRPSMVDPFVPFIVEQLGKYPSLRSSRLFVMIKERGYPGGPDHLRRVIGRLRPKKPAEAFQRLRTLPGEQAQVDWAHFGKLAVGRALRPLWAFVMVLSYSRRIFLRVGKTMILKNVAHQAVVRGHTVRFSTASDMLADLAAQESSAALARRLRRYTVPALLCIDEVGYLSYDSRYADLLFEVVTRRYDAQKPILLSTNKAFADWGQVFPHAACVVTLVDRLVHRAEVIEIEAESYRLKEAKELSATRTKQRRTKKH
ncbi:ATP-binding protein [Sorangium sp. So ce131]|uniref:ATP-binding protein n=1 Tax=Sorangium sp. So ce131 TaxID=3133282 RepID=UPI003F5FE95E